MAITPDNLSDRYLQVILLSLEVTENSSRILLSSEVNVKLLQIELIIKNRFSLRIKKRAIV